jgi:hypothetical protein
VVTPDSPLTPSAPTSPPPTYQPRATFGTGTAPAAAAVPNAPSPSASAPLLPYGYGATTTPAYAPTPPPAVETYLATGTLTVEWPLKAETAEQALLAGEAICKKVLAADLAGDKAPGKAAADAEESPDETHFGAPPQVQMAVAQNPYSSYPSVPWSPYAMATAYGSSPTFAYVATISSQQRKAALAEAFGKAKSQAAEMAEAAGGKLGALTNVNGGVANFQTIGGFGACGVVAPAPTPADSNVMLRGDPNHCDFQARVYAQFRFE